MPVPNPSLSSHTTTSPGPLSPTNFGVLDSGSRAVGSGVPHPSFPKPVPGITGAHSGSPNESVNERNWRQGHWDLGGRSWQVKAKKRGHLRGRLEVMEDSLRTSGSSTAQEQINLFS